jgi:endonuclease-8
MRIVLPRPFVAVGFDVPVAEFITARDLLRHKALADSGPTCSTPGSIGWKPCRMRSHGGSHRRCAVEPRVLSGIGNVFKSEILFAAGIDRSEWWPISRSGSRGSSTSREATPGQRLDRSQTLSPVSGRRTTEASIRTRSLWVRRGKPSGGADADQAKARLDARLTYWCPRCQPVLSGSTVADGRAASQRRAGLVRPAG